MKIKLPLLILSASASVLYGQVPWSGFANNAQHTGFSPVAAQPLTFPLWSTPIDFNPPGGANGSLNIHYGSPIVSAGNTVLVPVKTGSSGGFEVMAFNNGKLLYTLGTDYTLPPSNWIPPYGPVLAGTRLYYPGAGGTVYYRDSVDSTTGATGQVAFYGINLYHSQPASFNKNVMISTPLVADIYGNIYFGFLVRGANPAKLVSGIARIDQSGSGSWVSATSAAGGDTSIVQVQTNCAPAISNDQKTVYIAVSSGATYGTGYLVSLDAGALKPIFHIKLLDPRGGAATLSSDSSATPMVGPDNDIYYGILENPCCSSHNDRGWMLHFSADLRTTKTPGSFGWDTTASVVPVSAVPSYKGTSSYLIMNKYNNYAGIGTGNGVNKLAVLDPNGMQQDEYSSTPVTVMKEILTLTGLTSTPKPKFPNAVREWCINTAAISVDPVTHTANVIANSEDGVVYVWDLSHNTVSQSVRLTPGRSEAYTPAVIGVDGTVYVINDAILFAVGYK